MARKEGPTPPRETMEAIKKSLKNKPSMNEAEMAKRSKAARAKRNAGKYSPAPMSAAAKAKAGARGKETAAKTKPKSTAAQVAKRFGITVREANDIAKALRNVGTSAKSALNLDRTGNQYLGRQAVRETGKDLGKQIKEFGSAVKSGKPGSRAGTVSYNSDTGTPQGLNKRRAPKTNFRPDYSSEYGGPYKTGKKKK